MYSFLDCSTCSCAECSKRDNVTKVYLNFKLLVPFKLELIVRDLRFLLLVVYDMYYCGLKICRDDWRWIHCEGRRE